MDGYWEIKLFICDHLGWDKQTNKINQHIY